MVKMIRDNKGRLPSSPSTRRGISTMNASG